MSQTQIFVNLFTTLNNNKKITSKWGNEKMSQTQIFVNLFTTLNNNKKITSKWGNEKNESGTNLC